MEMVYQHVLYILATVIILTITYDSVITLLIMLYLATTNHWVGHGPPDPPC